MRFLNFFMPFLLWWPSEHAQYFQYMGWNAFSWYLCNKNDLFTIVNISSLIGIVLFDYMELNDTHRKNHKCARSLPFLAPTNHQTIAVHQIGGMYVCTFLSATPQPPCYRRGSTFHSCFVVLVSRSSRCAVVNDHFTLSGPFKVSRFIDQYLLNLLANQTYGEVASRGGIPWIAALSALHEAELWLGASCDVDIELTSNNTLPQLISLIRFFAVVMIDDSRCCVDEMNVPIYAPPCVSQRCLTVFIATVVSYWPLNQHTYEGFWLMSYDEYLISMHYSAQATAIVVF